MELPMLLVAPLPPICNLPRQIRSNFDMWQFDAAQVPSIQTSLPGPKARALLGRDENSTSLSYTCVYPLVFARGTCAVMEDVDGNRFHGRPKARMVGSVCAFF